MQKSQTNDYHNSLDIKKKKKRMSSEVFLAPPCLAVSDFFLSIFNLECEFFNGIL